MNIENLKCVKCNLYLSVFPVKLTNEGNVCGRCECNDGIVNKTYQKIVEDKSIHFPDEECVASSNQLICPLKCCSLSRGSLTPHFKDSHKDLIVAARRDIDINLENDTDLWFCITEFTEPFLLNIKLTDEAFKINIYSSRETSTSLNYKIRISSTASSKNLSLKSLKSSWLQSDSDDQVIVPINILNFIAFDTPAVSVKFSGELSEYEDVFHCPLDKDKGCRYSSNLEDMRKHCIRDHICWKLPLPDTTCTLTEEPVVRLLEKNGELFKSWRMYKENTLYWIPLYVGPREMAKDFCYRITLKTKNQQFTFTSRVALVYTDNTEENLDSIFVPDVLNPYCTDQSFLCSFDIYDVME